MHVSGLDAIGMVNVDWESVMVSLEGVVCVACNGLSPFEARMGRVKDDEVKLSFSTEGVVHARKR